MVKIPPAADFMLILLAIENRCPVFLMISVGSFRAKPAGLTISPEDFVNSLDSSEFAALMIAAGRCLAKGAASYEC
ncbi:hypothetical protein EZJ55_24795 [Microcystis aeruginosa EAWAG127a]|uniref:Uncharacterized protein n=1 Tax=Microcystis aeruginosa EAWAG127a TaxID=2529855 RepID=A0A5J5LPL3_MICAE|nr:hypothetical protein [Microcystis aeruginosa]KAB0238286.1 hypothetical protein EZJ55_24795 [Microcystis aeruginosa EAWAG127a]